MKKILIALVVLALLGAVVVIGGVGYLRSGIPFGIDEAHPLGQLEKVEGYLVTLGLEKDEGALNSLSKTLLDRQVLFYIEPLPEGTDREPDSVTVVADAEGVIREVAAQLPNESSKVRLLCELYWNAAGGKTPDFAGSDPKKETSKDFIREKVRGSWSRTGTREKVQLRVR